MDYLQVMAGLGFTGSEHIFSTHLGDSKLLTELLSARIQTPPEEIRKLLTLPQFKPEFREQKESELRVLVLHDSFFNKLKPFVSENFKQALYIWQFYDERTMEGLTPEKLEHVLSAFKPDLVIEEVVERRLDRLFYCVDQDWTKM